jgi:hypothetical protein
VRFRFQRLDTLPRLGWCARVTRGDDEVVVWHGPWVETRPGAFVEGVWDGPFAADGFDRAATFCGSGGRLDGDGVVFASATHLYEPIQSLRVGDALLVSNSVVFLLVEADDEPDPAYLHYGPDLLEYWRLGTAGGPKTFPTARGRRFERHHGRNLLVRPDLSLGLGEKPAPPAPRDYGEYVGQLGASVARLVENAAHPDRRQRFRPLAMLSTGYDSNALAALFAHAGCREAMTFVPGGPEDQREEDRGTEIGRHLGLTVTEYPRLAFKRLPGLPEAEFFAGATGEDMNLAVVEPQLAGALLVTGRNADFVWDTDPEKIVPEHRKPRDQFLGGTALVEYRLRVGFVHGVLLTTHLGLGRALLGISTSAAMRPWSIGGSYDRPLPRRLLEDAGVPRALVGQTKRSGMAYHVLRLEDFSPASGEDFVRFCRDCPLLPRARRLRFARMWMLYHLTNLPVRALRWLGRLGGRPLGLRAPMHERYRCWPTPLSRTYHWGFARTRDRYARPRSNGRPG